MAKIYLLTSSFLAFVYLLTATDSFVNRTDFPFKFLSLLVLFNIIWLGYSVNENKMGLILQQKSGGFRHNRAGFWNQPHDSVHFNSDIDFMEHGYFSLARERVSTLPPD